MKILLISSNYKPFFNAGGETYLHTLAKALIGFGHEVKAIVNHPEPYEYEGIECRSQGALESMWSGHTDLIKWCDVIFTQLNGTAYAYNRAYQHSKPLVFIAHNTSRSYPISIGSNIFVIYNSEFVKKTVNFPHKSFVLPPPIDYRDFKISPFDKRKYVTLINCNEAKGGKLFIELAGRLPDIQFLGIKGPKTYGEQFTAELPNLTYVENGESVKEYLAETKVLLMPSDAETYGQAATEAICCGIPVLCSPVEGLKENLSHSGIYIERNNVDLYTQIIRLLYTDDAYYRLQAGLCHKRAISLDPQPKLNELNNWLLKTITWQPH